VGPALVVVLGNGASRNRRQGDRKTCPQCLKREERIIESLSLFGVPGDEQFANLSGNLKLRLGNSMRNLGFVTFEQGGNVEIFPGWITRTVSTKDCGSYFPPTAALLPNIKFRPVSDNQVNAGFTTQLTRMVAGRKWFPAVRERQYRDTTLH
jgi:hypothetical protein